MSKENKSKWELMIDAMMIIGKYFESNNDFINVMKLAKKYRDLVKMYHYNPIDDTSMFIKMQTQHFYIRTEINQPQKTKKSGHSNEYEGYKKKKGMKRYIYWYRVSLEEFNKRKKKDVFRKVELSSSKKDNVRICPLSTKKVIALFQKE